MLSKEEVYERARYFLERVIPHAEKHGVQLACHLEDPPAPVLRGIEMWNYPERTSIQGSTSAAARPEVTRPFLAPAPVDGSHQPRSAGDGCVVRHGSPGRPIDEPSPEVSWSRPPEHEDLVLQPSVATTVSDSPSQRDELLALERQVSGSAHALEATVLGQAPRGQGSATAFDEHAPSTNIWKWPAIPTIWVRLGLLLLAASPLYNLIVVQILDPNFLARDNNCVYRDQTEYMGDDLHMNNNKSLPTVGWNVNATDKCCDLCQEIDGCKFFTFHKNPAKGRKNCQLKKSIAENVTGHRDSRNRRIRIGIPACISGACVSHDSNRFDYGKLLLSIVQNTVMSKVLPLLFTIVLWAAYFRNLERNEEGWSVPSPPQIRARGSVFGVGGALQPGPALVLSRRWIKISIGICVSIFCTQVVQHVAYEEYTQRNVAHLMRTERSYYHDHPFWRPNNFDLANPAKHHSAWETAFFYVFFG